MLYLYKTVDGILLWITSQQAADKFAEKKNELIYKQYTECGDVIWQIVYHKQLKKQFTRIYRGVYLEGKW